MEDQHFDLSHEVYFGFFNIKEYPPQKSEGAQLC